MNCVDLNETFQNRDYKKGKVRQKTFGRHLLSRHYRGVSSWHWVQWLILRKRRQHAATVRKKSCKIVHRMQLIRSYPWVTFRVSSRCRGRLLLRFFGQQGVQLRNDLKRVCDVQPVLPRAHPQLGSRLMARRSLINARGL